MESTDLGLIRRCECLLLSEFVFQLYSVECRTGVWTMCHACMRWTFIHPEFSDEMSNSHVAVVQLKHGEDAACTLLGLSSLAAQSDVGAAVAVLCLTLK